MPESIMDNLRREVLKRIVLECRERNAETSKEFASFLLNLFQLNPTYELKSDDEESKEKIVRAIVEKLCARDSPSLTVLKSQLYFAKYYHDRDETIRRCRLRLHRKTGPLVADICHADKVADKREMEKLYQKILVVIALLSGLGSPTVPAVLREISVTLQSVFQPAELERYAVMSRREKEEQLMELMCIVAGIRLFNRDCGRGGEGIDDLPGILQKVVERTKASVMEFLDQLMTKVYKITAVVAKVSLVKDIIPFGVYSLENVKWAIEMLTACRQHEIYARKLLSDAERSEKETRCLLERLQGRLFKLHDTVRFRTAIPTSQVYPQFIDLTDIWMGLQDEVTILASINSFLWELRSLGAKSPNAYNETVLFPTLSTEEVLTDAERLEKSMGKLISNRTNPGYDFDDVALSTANRLPLTYFSSRMRRLYNILSERDEGFGESRSGVSRILRVDVRTRERRADPGKSEQRCRRVEREILCIRFTDGCRRIRKRSRQTRLPGARFHTQSPGVRVPFSSVRRHSGSR